MNKKFLVVDDSKIAREKISCFLKDLGYNTIHHAEDGLIALERFRKIDYDFIIMDLEMPNMKGNAAAKEMLKTNPNINIMLITSIVDKKELIFALKLGVKKILQKPITFQEFDFALNKLIKEG